MYPVQGWALAEAAGGQGWLCVAGHRTANALPVVVREPAGPRGVWHPPGTLSEKIKRDKLGTELPYEYTTNRQQKNQPITNGRIQKGVFPEALAWTQFAKAGRAGSSLAAGGTVVGQAAGSLAGRTGLGDGLAPAPSATQGVLAVVDGTAQSLQHDLQ